MPPTGGHLWSESYDRNLTDLFVLQDEITRDIVGVVAPQVLVAEMQRARRKDPRSAWTLWEVAMRAQWHLAQLTREDNAEALRLAMKSAEQDPTIPLASTLPLSRTSMTRSTAGAPRPVASFMRRQQGGARGSVARRP